MAAWAVCLNKRTSFYNPSSLKKYAKDLKQGKAEIVLISNREEIKKRIPDYVFGREIFKEDVHPQFSESGEFLGVEIRDPKSYLDAKISFDMSAREKNNTLRVSFLKYTQRFLSQLDN